MQEKLRKDCMSFDGFITYIRLGIQQSVGNELLFLNQKVISHQPYTLTIIIRPM